MARRPPHENQIAWLSLATGAPALLLAMLFTWSSHLTGHAKFTLTLLCAIGWLGGALWLRARVMRPLQTLSNLMAALREGDYSIRARGAEPDSPLGLAFFEVNALADSLRGQRLDALEAVALLRHVMEDLEVAIFGFDPDRRLRLINAGGEALLALPAERALGSDAGSLGLAQALEGETPRLTDWSLAGRSGRWELRRGAYRWEGRPHQLVVLSDLTRTLREEERDAWQRLIRVLSHEINNSLAPIQSIAGSLGSRLARTDTSAADPAIVADFTEGLGVIEARAGALGRFIQAYATLARLPQPSPRRIDVPAWVRRVTAIETRVLVEVTGGPELTLSADPDQLDALLINLVRNAADAALETSGGVRVAWRASNGTFELTVEDDGPGLPNPSNLFVPFFTTKPEGSGIGLSLCRQIVEAHGGMIALANRPGARGAVATVRLPSGVLAE
ncbi:MAG: PAS domain-containing sensor histidine kinase [Candidatus Eisenbacteria bacterium]|uniref:histidine kinase n=1 Tax=Eiseniibacteriota bacterium TaxID=2212470 RepID=A0A849SU04_UNCEI|nr:PAS domain-containing sensor histidine kinase [Candidatus Eisenbacteria bacterium]